MHFLAELNNCHKPEDRQNIGSNLHSRNKEGGLSPLCLFLDMELVQVIMGLSQ